MSSFHDEHQPTGIEQLFDKLGAEVAVRLVPYAPMPANRRAVRRLLVETEMEELADATAPEWAARKGVGQASVLTCVWDKPVPERAAHRRYMMRSILGAGCWEDQVSHIWCYPYDQTAPPLASQLLQYRELTLRALAATDTRYVLLVGAAALSMWRPQIKLKDVQGYSGVMEGKYIVQAIANPVSVLRDPMLQGEWRLGLYAFMDMVNSQEEFNLMPRCVTKDCTDGAMMYDPDGIGWCQRHWKKGTMQRENKLSSARKKSRRMNEEKLL